MNKDKIQRGLKILESINNKIDNNKDLTYDFIAQNSSYSRQYIHQIIKKGVILQPLYKDIKNFILNYQQA